MITTDIVRVDFEDSDGIKRRVLLPAGVTEYDEGIPVSVNVDYLYMHCSIDFRRRLVEELWARNLIEPCDYVRPGAPELIRAAIHAATKADTLDILALATKECNKKGA